MGVLVSELRRDRGRIVYLHFSAQNMEQGDVRRATAAALQKVADDYQIEPSLEGSEFGCVLHDISVQRFHVSGGETYVLWNRPPLRTFQFQYARDKQQFLAYESPAFQMQAVVHPPGRQSGEFLVYDFWNDSYEPENCRSRRASSDFFLEFDHGAFLCGSGRE